MKKKLNQGTLTTITKRWKSGFDIRPGLQAFCKENSIEAAIVLSAVGSLEHAAIRFAGQSEPESVPGPLEILSLNGTVSAQGTHLHLAVSNGEGTCLGGHLLAGCPVNTTLEITLGIIPELQFDRTHDNETGFQELEIWQRTK